MGDFCAIQENKPCTFTVDLNQDGRPDSVTVNYTYIQDKPTDVFTTSNITVTGKLNGDSNGTVLFSASHTSAHNDRARPEFVWASTQGSNLVLERGEGRQSARLNMVRFFQVATAPDVRSLVPQRPQETKAQIQTRRMGVAGVTMTTTGLGVAIFGGVLAWAASEQAKAANDLDPMSRLNVLNEADRTSAAGYAIMGINLTVTLTGAGFWIASEVRNRRETLKN